MEDTKKLLLPRHSYNASVSSTGSNSVLPKNRSGSRLSRTNTNVTDAGASAAPPNDSHSIRTVDKIPSARPSVSYLDKLWTQIDVLDDVKTMSGEVRSKGSFFNDKFDAELKRLKQLQNRLLETLATQQFNNSSKLEHRKQLSRLNTMNEPIPQVSTSTSASATGEDKKRQEKATEFFGMDDLSKYSQDILYRKQNFEEMNQYVAEIKDNLDRVGENMKKFDESTRELW
ncbi:uncharacterized protein CANTADRAFT_49404 [Suhomyces tanzawaensis NRRL Y-17324]|uniref:Uncharacterized protein n=1 Tax=Suhomyces tanzawaensis NRRL Y-17324 TaxID=984487 RepID=A0A1E4SKP8_9ASCO|nr:uncharacterized protein CANTADRAFT_49404 [Suhomyces tanzawaensis NRRL Y-17324]ODV80002.1 hypothetical protein CANTADRAFT_49404 [Suhomyces tanzawaensis NRRL Y-17324]